ncbi:MAG: hypothetical protein HY006_01275 [Candidatus Sungbacteria bacterium]|nr:hypothetical protein [Candidatus Sungbacteria bacterium]
MNVVIQTGMHVPDFIRFFSACPFDARDVAAMEVEDVYLMRTNGFFVDPFWIARFTKTTWWMYADGSPGALFRFLACLRQSERLAGIVSDEPICLNFKRVSFGDAARALQEAAKKTAVVPPIEGLPMRFDCTKVH